MTIQEYEDEIIELIKDASIIDIHTSPDFQCDQTDGFPTSLCVNWDKGKAWLTLNYHLVDDDMDITQYLQGCAEFGIRNCVDAEDFDNLLDILGEDAYQSACLHEDDNITMEGI
ncbi:MAG: hypothetical protein IJB65_00855 [Clostridia bacterium]|nr:hypothetical protein [Clostridia bacterium]